MENYLIKNMIEVIKLFLYVFTIYIGEIQYITTNVYYLYNKNHFCFYIINKKNFIIHFFSSGEFFYDD